MKQIVFLALTLLLWSAASMNAQVTIGSSDTPHEGAVLDLSKATGNSAGLLLPRVSLSDVSTWQIGGDSDTGISMLVYNTNGSVIGGNGSGIYVWNGLVWTALNTTTDMTPFITDGEGNQYSVALFGDAGWWMTENLRATQYADGTPLTISSNMGKDDDFSLRYAYYPGNSIGYVESMGMLYSWTAASNGILSEVVEIGGAGSASTSKIQGICPTGWHLPNDYEWTQLEKEIAVSAAGVYSTLGPLTWDDEWSTKMEARGDYAIKLKSPFWGFLPDPVGSSNNNKNNGFAAQLAGYITVDGLEQFPVYGRFWSSSALKSPNLSGRLPIYREVRNVQSQATYRRINKAESAYLSVRCKKD
jgi:uncharacterized protein (TIGR02145 family)